MRTASEVSDSQSIWLEDLRARCAKSSQAAVAAQMLISDSVVSSLLSGKYKGSLNAMKRRFEGAFRGLMVDCPVLGEIGAHQCLKHQQAEFAGTNPQRVALWRACRSGCPNAIIAADNGVVSE